MGVTDSLHAVGLVVEADLEMHSSEDIEATPATGACTLQVVQLEVEADHEIPFSKYMEATPDPGALVEPNPNITLPHSHRKD